MTRQRPSFTKEENEAIGELIKSNKYSDKEIAVKFKCSPTTIKLIRTSKYRCLRMKRREYTDQIKQAACEMYCNEGKSINEIARLMRIKYKTVWGFIDNAGLRIKTGRRVGASVADRRLFNYVKWLEDFKLFIKRKRNIRSDNVFRKWAESKEGQKEVYPYLKEFSESRNKEMYFEVSHVN
jgi:DNA-binding CsgD family transcriptional regulator